MEAEGISNNKNFQQEIVGETFPYYTAQQRLLVASEPWGSNMILVGVCEKAKETGALGVWPGSGGGGGGGAA